jgi:hypothetical protein
MNKILKKEDIIIDGTYTMDKSLYISRMRIHQGIANKNDFFKEGSIIEINREGNTKKLNCEVLAVASNGKYLIIKLLRK